VAGRSGTRPAVATAVVLLGGAAAVVVGAALAAPAGQAARTSHVIVVPRDYPTIQAAVEFEFHELSRGKGRA
jgi:hypothetical protein